MNVQEILSHFDNVKQTGQSAWIASCPCGSNHKNDDRSQSLSIGIGRDARILLKCHTGCEVEQICKAVNLEMKDLFQDQRNQSDGSPANAAIQYYKQKGLTFVDAYNYCYGAFRDGMMKLRFKDGSGKKVFRWIRNHPDNPNSFKGGQGDCKHRLFVAGNIDDDAIIITEGEKDARTAHNLLHMTGACSENGATTGKSSGGKWREEYNQQLKGKAVYIFCDNDEAGRNFARIEADEIGRVASAVYIIDISKAWKECPDKGDITDFVKAVGQDEAYSAILDYLDTVKPEPKAEQADKQKNIQSLLTSFSDIAESEVKWLIPGRIPAGEISVIGADGGSGKGYIVMDTVASISRGSGGILYEADGLPLEFKFPPGKVVYFSSEDDPSKVLKPRLRACEAVMSNIYTVTEGEFLNSIKFGEQILDQIIERERPELCIFDPIQSFLPPRVEMSARNQMRNCLNSLVTLAHKYGTTFIIISHTNKKRGVYGRQRLADSSDLWDIARSVFLCGVAANGDRYFSHEKSNYGKLSETILFQIEDVDGTGRARYIGTTQKKDRDFITEEYSGKQGGRTSADEAADFIVNELSKAENCQMPVKDLDELAKANGFSGHSISEAKKKLGKQNRTNTYKIGFSDAPYVIELLPEQLDFDDEIGDG